MANNDGILLSQKVETVAQTACKMGGVMPKSSRKFFCDFGAEGEYENGKNVYCI